MIGYEDKTMQQELDSGGPQVPTTEPSSSNPTASDGAPAAYGNQPSAVEVEPQKPTGWFPIATITREKVHPDTTTCPMGAAMRHSFHAKLADSIARGAIVVNEGDE
eukprot:5637249-Pyramimonas_sp.AAC.1